MKKVRTGIYFLLNLVNNKMYIGSAIDLDTRKNTHFSRLKLQKHPNQHLQASYNKYGKDAFVFGILSFCSKEDLLKKEQYYIDYFGGPKELYNIREKAENNSGLKHSEKAKEKVRSFMKGNKYAIGNKNCLGRKLSNEVKERLRQANLGKKHSQETKDKVSRANKGKIKTESWLKNLADSNAHYYKILNPNGEIIIGKNISELCRQHNLSNAHLVSVLKGKRKQHKGWRLPPSETPSNS